MKAFLVIAAVLSLTCFRSEEYSLDEPEEPVPAAEVDCYYVGGTFPQDKWECCNVWSDGSVTDCEGL